ncbi:KCNK18 [Lepeophtheirus salmonis]|uniref:KCNK18 n=1 Tax=Lepeophtheirus salmonis TaxID=72036 RepID=A0A7R8H7E9_LEPSM|nr:KCNK18 [Lepeophtheirus salmonis]CAF2921979.1 KCNK18 [Lepeophtheirus salmonis]
MNNIGHILGTSFKYTYSKFCRCSKPSPHDYVGKGPLPSSLVEVSSLGGDDKTSKRSSSRSKVSNSSTTNATLTSISPDDEIENEFRMLSFAFKRTRVWLKVIPLRNRLERALKRKKRNYGGNTVEFKLVEDIRLVTVPVTSCILVLIGYIIFGAVLFSAWEGWDYMDGAYFCFTSLMTIGFGDFVPGNDYIYHVDPELEAEAEGKAKLVLGAIYILLGMALIAMCFNLMQEKIIMQLRTIARRLGLLRPTNLNH